MKPERILLPIDIHRCPLEVFELVNGFAKGPEATVILLHVVHLNILAPDTRVYDELGQEAQMYLQRLADKYIPPIVSTIIHVRTGNPSEQILLEASNEAAELIILPTYGPSFWKRVIALWKPASTSMVSTLTQKIIREATCGVFVVQAKTRFDCERAWGRPEKERRGLRQAEEFQNYDVLAHTVSNPKNGIYHG